MATDVITPSGNPSKTDTEQKLIQKLIHYEILNFQSLQLRKSLLLVTLATLNSKFSYFINIKRF
jgi:hypothetical protein